MPDSEITQLRELLKERFPEAQMGASPKGDTALQTGLQALDAVGLVSGTLCEAVAETRSLGSGLLLTKVLRGIASQNKHAVLIDGHDTFDPQSLGIDDCRHLLWVRCLQVSDAMKVADLLLRDGNLSLVVMDLELSPLRELARIPQSSWFRLRSLVERMGATLLVITPVKLVGCAHLRLQLEHAFAIDDLEELEEDLATRLTLRVVRRRVAAVPQLEAEARTG